MKSWYGWLFVFIVLISTINTVSAFSDDFSVSPSLNGWTVIGGAFSNTGNVLYSTSTGRINHTISAGDRHFEFRITREDPTFSHYSWFCWNHSGGTNCGNGIWFATPLASDQLLMDDISVPPISGSPTFSISETIIPADAIVKIDITQGDTQIRVRSYYFSNETLVSDETVAYTHIPVNKAMIYIESGGTSIVTYDDLLTSSVDPDAVTTGNIYFDEDTYALEDAFDITATLVDPDYEYYLYYYDLVDPNGIVRETGQIYEGATFPGHDTSSTVADIPGTWEIQLYGCGLGICWANRVDIDDDQTSVIGGTGAYTSYIFFDKVNYDLSEVASITYSIDNENWTASPWGTNFRIEITDNEGTGYFDLQLKNQNGSINYVFPDTGVYRVNLVKREWGIFGEYLSYDSATVTEDLVNTNGYGLNLNPSTVNCGMPIFFTVYSDNPAIYDTYLNVSNGTTTISSVEITSNPASFSLTFGTYSGSYYARVMNGSTVEKQQLIKINSCYGGNTGGGIQPGSGLGDGNTYTPDEASSNAQQNFINFMAMPIFWGLIIFIVFIMALALNHYGDAIPYVAPLVIFLELVVGLLEPYTAFIGISTVITVIGMILIKQRS